MFVRLCLVRRAAGTFSGCCCGSCRALTVSRAVSFRLRPRRTPPPTVKPRTKPLARPLARPMLKDPLTNPLKWTTRRWRLSRRTPTGEKSTNNKWRVGLLLRLLFSPFVWPLAACVFGHRFVGADLQLVCSEAVLAAVRRLFGSSSSSSSSGPGLAVTAADLLAGLRRVRPSALREVQIRHNTSRIAEHKARQDKREREKETGERNIRCKREPPTT